MGLGATYRVERDRIAYVFTADLVGTPALGPTPFMHRASARNNPQVPITHHFLDSTHLTPGVLGAGAEVGPLTFEGSIFRGEEPDENRLNINRPRLDSWSARIRWQRGPWEAQVSGAALHEPEWFEPYDVDRYTASIAFTGTAAGRPLAVTGAWGKNIDYNGFDNNSDGYLLEWDFGATAKSWIYGRADRAIKQLFGLGGHPPGFGHRHSYSTLDALTVGFTRDLWVERWGRLGVGGDATAYRMSPDMVPYYGGSHSYHVFVRWRPNVSAAMHVH